MEINEFNKDTSKISYGCTKNINYFISIITNK